MWFLFVVSGLVHKFSSKKIAKIERSMWLSSSKSWSIYEKSITITRIWLCYRLLTQHPFEGTFRILFFYLKITKSIDIILIQFIFIFRLEWHKTITEGLKEYCALIDSSSSFRAYRQALAETNIRYGCIPYMYVQLKIIFLIDKQLLKPFSSFLSQWFGSARFNICAHWQPRLPEPRNNQLLKALATTQHCRQYEALQKVVSNWIELRLLFIAYCKILIEISLNICSSSYPFKKNLRIIEFFDNFENYLDEDAMWQISETIKPRVSRKPLSQSST